MPTKEKYEDHAWVLKQLKAAQEAEHDMRQHVREAHLFVDKRDGQWEPYIWDQQKGQPRYTFDMTNPIIDQICGDIGSKDFNIRVAPAGGDATKETAQTYDGLIRNIENISNSTSIYDSSVRNMVTSGLDGWRLVQRYVDDDSFDQDLVIERIGNYVDRVWLGPHEEPDGSDARMGWILTGLDASEYKSKYPEGTAAGVTSDRDGTAYYYRHDLIMVGEFLYFEEQERELILMSSGAVYEDNAEFAMVKDELAEVGIVEVRRRKRANQVVYSRLFNNNDWITEPRETVFQNWIPVQPLYGNFKYFEDKVTYWGAVEKVLDAQRNFNYAKSRQIAEGSLAPRAKYWMTRAQAEGHEDKLATMNTNSDPVQFYNPDPDVPGPPGQSGGAVINPGLKDVSDDMINIIGVNSGMFDASMGDNPGLQSGVAIDALIDRGDQGNDKYTTALERAEQHTARMLVDAIPRVYTPGRQVRLLKEDGTQQMQTLGEQVTDEDTQQVVTLNDLNAGKYDVTCTSGPAFKNRQSETVTALTEVGKVDPTVIELGGDILLNNVASPGMTELAERKRQQLFSAGLIPQDQMTDEEKAQADKAANQPPQEDPNMVLARAEEAKAQADMVEAQTKQSQVQMDAQNKQAQNKIDAFNAETKRLEAQIEFEKVKGELKGTGAKAALDLANAEAQDLENDAVQSGVMELVDSING